MVQCTTETQIMLEFNTSKDAENTAQTLQLHFFGWWRGHRFRAPIPQELITRALELLLYLLPHMKPYSDKYVREKLNINSGPIDDGIRATMHHVVAPEAKQPEAWAHAGGISKRPKPRCGVT